jgi:hypothetical protein
MLVEAWLSSLALQKTPAKAMDFKGDATSAKKNLPFFFPYLFFFPSPLSFSLFLPFSSFLLLFPSPLLTREERGADSG